MIIKRYVLLGSGGSSLEVAPSQIAYSCLVGDAKFDSRGV